jgi:hypothetical protein
MAVVANFEANPVDSEKGLIPPSQAVQFQDLSTGSPDSWLWEFGDGEFSTDQNPLHTYVGSSLDKFTVKLTAWIADTPIIQNRTEVKATRQGNIIEGNAAAFAEYLIHTWGSNTPDVAAFMCRWTGTSPDRYIYLGARVLGTCNAPSLVGADVGYFVEAQRLVTDAVLNRTITEQDSNFKINVAGSLRATVSGVGAAGTDWFPVADVSDIAGAGVVQFDFTPETESQVEPGGIGCQTGVIGRSRLVRYIATAVDNKDTETKTDYVVFGAPPVAAFSASPLAGANPLQVQFTNESTEAIGLPTTYSWKKRKSGSGDPFVEFSTEKHPIFTFTKT